MKAITNIETLERGDMLLYFDQGFKRWKKAIIIEKMSIYIDIMSIEGTLKGFSWNVSPGDLLDPDKYMILDND